MGQLTRVLEVAHLVLEHPHPSTCSTTEQKHHGQLHTESWILVPCLAPQAAPTAAARSSLQSHGLEGLGVGGLGFSGQGIGAVGSTGEHVHVADFSRGRMHLGREVLGCGEVWDFGSIVMF